MIGLLFRHQGFAQARAGDFKHMEARCLEGNADHFRLALRQRLEQGKGLNLVLWTEYRCFRAIAGDRPVTELVVEFAIVVGGHVAYAFHPGDDFQRLLRHQFLGTQYRMALGQRADGAQGERQHGVGVLFHYAEVRGKFGQGRSQIGLDAEREFARVGERPACVILEAFGQP